MFCPSVKGMAENYSLYILLLKCLSRDEVTIGQESQTAGVKEGEMWRLFCMRVSDGL